jgi:hypothetical protein
MKGRLVAWTYDITRPRSAGRSRRPGSAPRSTAPSPSSSRTSTPPPAAPPAAGATSWATPAGRAVPAALGPPRLRRVRQRPHRAHRRHHRRRHHHRRHRAGRHNAGHQGSVHPRRDCGGSTATLTLNATVLGVIDFASAGLAQLDCVHPHHQHRHERAAGHDDRRHRQVTCTYGDRTDALVTRLGLANGSSRGRSWRPGRPGPSPNCGSGTRPRRPLARPPCRSPGRRPSAPSRSRQGHRDRRHAHPDHERAGHHVGRGLVQLADLHGRRPLRGRTSWA